MHTCQPTSGRGCIMVVLVVLNDVAWYRVPICGKDRHFKWFLVIEIIVIMSMSNSRNEYCSLQRHLEGRELRNNFIRFGWMHCIKHMHCYVFQFFDRGTSIKIGFVVPRLLENTIYIIFWMEVSRKIHSLYWCTPNLLNHLM